MSWYGSFVEAFVREVLRLLHRERRCHARNSPRAIAGARNGQLISLSWIDIFVKVQASGDSEKDSSDRSGRNPMQEDADNPCRHTCTLCEMRRRAEACIGRPSESMSPNPGVGCSNGVECSVMRLRFPNAEGKCRCTHLTIVSLRLHVW